MLFRKSNKVYLHIDCDSFFASCEILKNPNLKWKFVCVWSEIVVACTYNCKALGIKTWTPVWEAEKILKNHWLFLSPDIDYYSQISDNLFNFLREKVLTLEPFSIDECFCEITWLAELYKMNLWTFIKNLQKEVLEHIWIPVSIGCAETKIKAKIYSKLNKPFGIYIWFDKEREKELYKNLSISKIPFIGKKYTEKLYRSKTIYDFLQIWYWNLKKEIWKNATDLWLELAWVNAFNLRNSKEVKSISRTRSFNKQITNDKDFLISQTLIHFEIVFEEIVEKNLEIKSIKIMFRTKDFGTSIYNYNFGEHTNIRTSILNALLYLFDKNYDSTKLYRSVWVVFSNFRSYIPRQISLFDKNIRSKDNNYILTKSIEALNKKYGSHKVSFWTSILGRDSGRKVVIMK